MKTLVCPTCGCSLVRLGISKDEAVAHSHESKEYYFCCDGCLEQFIADPEKHLHETGGRVEVRNVVADAELHSRHGSLHLYVARDGNAAPRLLGP